MNKIAEDLLKEGKSYQEAIDFVYGKMREIVKDPNRNASSVDKIKQYLDAVHDLNIAKLEAETKPIDSKVVKAAMELFKPREGGLF